MPAAEAEARPKTSGRSATPKEIEEWAAKKGEAYSPKSSPKGAVPSPPASAAAAAAAAAAAEAAPKLPNDNPKAVARMLASGRGPLGTNPSEPGYPGLVFFPQCSAHACPLRTAAWHAFRPTTVDPWHDGPSAAARSPSRCWRARRSLCRRASHSRGKRLHADFRHR
jgi:hypothetical protein